MKRKEGKRKKILGSCRNNEIQWKLLEDSLVFRLEVWLLACEGNSSSG